MNTYLRLEKCLLPPPKTVHWENGNLQIKECSTTEKVIFFTKNILQATTFLLISPITLCHDFFSKKNTVIQPKFYPYPTNAIWPPHQRGFASSLFQLSGLGTKWSACKDLTGKCDWDQWMEDLTHIQHAADFNYDHFFVDILSDPSAYIQMLKEHNVTAHRFSLEWSVLQPNIDTFDEKAIKLYQNFIQELIKANITPSITINHFVVPEWFFKIGNFQKIENIDLFVNFALKTMEIFSDVKDFWSFNELGVKAFQQLREVYPIDVPKNSSITTKVHAAGNATVNMLIAHCKLHQKMQTLHPEKKLGVTHQWLKFDTASGNFLEKFVVYYLEKLTFYPVYNFFLDGQFRFEIPFMANIHFTIPKREFEANKRFLNRLGVQAYPKPLLKMGFNTGQKLTVAKGSYQNSIFTFGSCCEQNSAIMRFGPRWKASAIDEILDEAFEISDEVFITEYGSDACIQKNGSSRYVFDDEAQKQYLQKLTERIETYCKQNKKQLQGIFCWSDLRQQMEWENGLFCRLALVNASVDENRKFISWEKTEASQYLASIYAQKKLLEKSA